MSKELPHDLFELIVVATLAETAECCCAKKTPPAAAEGAESVGALVKFVHRGVGR